MANFIVLDPRRATQASLQPEDEVVLIDAQYDRTLSVRNPLVAVLWATVAVMLGCGVAWPYFGYATLTVLVPCFVVWLYAGVTLEVRLRGSTVFFRDVPDGRLVWSTRWALVSAAPFLVALVALLVWSVDGRAWQWGGIAIWLAGFFGSGAAMGLWRGVRSKGRVW